MPPLDFSDLTPKPQPQQAPDYTDYFNQAGEKHGLDPLLVRAVTDVESRGNRFAVSPTGAEGLMQLEPGTAAEMGVRDTFDPQQNVDGGTGYLRKQIDRFGGNVAKGLAAYNAGANGTWGDGVQGYVRNVTDRWDGYRGQRDAQPRATPRSAAPLSFDDLVPKKQTQQPAAAVPLSFDDLIPKRPPIPENGRPLTNKQAVATLPMAKTGSDAPPEPVTTGMDPAAIAAPTLTPAVGGVLDAARAAVTAPASPEDQQALQERVAAGRRIGSAAVEGFGTEPLGMTEQTQTNWGDLARKIGILPPAGQSGTAMQQFNQGVVTPVVRGLTQPAMALLDLAMRTGNAGLQATGQGAIELGKAYGMPEAGRELAGFLEYRMMTGEGGLPEKPPADYHGTMEQLRSAAVGEPGDMLTRHPEEGPGAPAVPARIAQEGGAPPPRPDSAAPPVAPVQPYGAPPGSGGDPIAQPTPPPAPPSVDPAADLAATAAGKPPSGTALPTLEAMAGRARPPVMPAETPPPVTDVSRGTEQEPIVAPPESQAAPVESTPPARPEANAAPYVMLDPDQLTLDPKRFQFKEADEQGRTGALAGVKRFDSDLAQPITAWQANDGTIYVANGHQRTNLAKDAKAAGQPDVQVPTRIYREADGFSPDYMRVLAAYQNIAEGSGSAVDAARVMRSTVAMPEGRALPDLPPKSALVQQAQSLKNLSPEAFGVVINGVVPSAYAAHVGDLISDPRQQMAALQVLHDAQPANSNQARTIVKDVLNTGFVDEGQEGLPGIEATTRSLIPERARVLDNAMRGLRRGKSLFGAAVKGEETLTGAGNVLDTASNVAAKSANERILDILDKNATSRGPVSDALNTAARDLADGKPVAAVTSRFLAAVRELERRGEAEGLRSRAPAGGDRLTGEAGEGPVEGQGGFGGFAESGTPIPLYSAVGRAVDALPQAKGTGAQMLAMIQKTPGVKAEELKWLGLDDWLRGQGHVTKAAIADYVRANSLDVREVTKGNVHSDEEYTAEKERVFWDGRQLGIDPDEMSIDKLRQAGASPDLIDRFHRFVMGGDFADEQGDTKFGQYTSPGGTGYRELLITLPVQKHSDVFRIAGGGPETMKGTTLWRMSPIKSVEDIPQWRQYNGSLADGVADMSDARLFDALQRARAGERGTEAPGAYQSSHWDEPNVLAHLRFSEYTAPDGARTLVLHEIQSDLHQQGRKQGYQQQLTAADHAEVARLRQELEDIRQERERTFGVLGRHERLTPEQNAHSEAMFNRSDEIRNHISDITIKDKRGVPDLPFKVSWPALVMRRAIKYAVDNGFDRLAWEGGDVQANRYDLSKHVDHVNWIPSTGELHAYKNSAPVLVKSGVQAKDLADHIGKDAAERLINAPDIKGNDPNVTPYKRIEGNDLKAGGAGQRKFYDQMLPNEVQKIVGKFGAKVGESEVPVGTPERDTLKPDEQAGQEHGPAWQRLVDERNATVERVQEDGTYGADPRLQDVNNRMDALHARMVDETLARSHITQSVHSVDLTDQLKHAVSTEGLALFQPRRLPIPPPAGGDLFGRDRAPPATRTPEPLIRTDPRQTVMPGMEPSAVQAQAASDAAGPRTGQLPANTGLFGVKAPVQPGLPMRVSRWLSDHGFVDHLASFPAVRPGQNPHAVAADWVFQKGRETGHEYIAVVDNRSGEVVHAGTANLPNEIPFSADNLTGSSASAFTVHHNHPSGRALSRQDLTMVGHTAIGHVVAHGHNGETFTASATAATADIADEHAAARRVTDAMIRPMAVAGKITYDEANAVFDDVLNRLLHADGIIRYASTLKLPPVVADALRGHLTRTGKNADIVDRSTDAVRSTERVAGLPAAVGEQQGQGPTGGEGGAGRRAPGLGTPPGRLLEGERQGFAEEPTTPLTPQEQRRAGPIRRAMTAATTAARDFAQSVANGFAPMQGGSVRAMASAADLANKLRQIQYRYGEIDREITRQFKPADREKMGRAMDAQSVAEQQIRDLPPDQQAAARAAFDATREGLAGLEPLQRHTLEMLDRQSGDVWRRMQERGLVAPNARPIPFYFARQVIQFSEDAGFSKVGGGGAGSGRGLDQRGANLTTQGPMRREHLTPEETEAAARAKFGPGALLLRDIRSLPARLAFSERAIAGTDLMNAIERVGHDTGVNLVVRGDIPGLLNPGDYFTLADHPSFRKWTGSGWQAIHVSKEFEGPLKAVLTQPSPTWYRGIQAVKGGVMSSIMYSPFIHLAVELGRSLPVMPGRILTLQALRDGSRLRRDLGYMDQATTDGLAPLGHGGGWRTDPVSLADQANVEGRNRFIRALGDMRDAAANAAGRIGGRFVHDVVQHPHQTLLWDQVFNLQVGIYDAMRSRYIDKGFAPDVAGTMAAHIANRYAGALPPEHLSKAANMAANLLLFSRSFTLGNLGVMKDLLNGAPGHVRARIEQMAGPDVAKSAQSALRRKAISAFTMDIGLFFLANGLLQVGLQVLRQTPEQGLQGAAQQTFQSWLDEAGSAVRGVPDNPLSIFKVLPQEWNEPGKTNRVYAGIDSQGRAIYLRLPPGKVGEEFVGWFIHPATMMENKMSPLVRPIIESIFGQDTLGRPIYKPNPQTIGDYLGIAGDVVKHFGEGLGPTSTIQGLYEMYQQHVLGKPTQADPYVSAAKVLGPLTGLAQVSSGFPGGPAAGEMHALSESQRYDLQKALPDIRDKIRSGDMAGAEDAFRTLQVPPQLARYYVRQTLHPEMMSRGSMMRLQGAPPNIQERVRRDLGTPP